MEELRINRKVMIVFKDGVKEFGTIQELYPPCDDHSGRIVVHINHKYYDSYAEFWYSDVGKSLILV